MSANYSPRALSPSSNPTLFACLSRDGVWKGFDQIMCGIAGWIAARPNSEASSAKTIAAQRFPAINRILDLQHHRGPDARGLWESPCGRAVLEHNRLSIVEPSEAGAQPMLDSDGGWAITFNVELYNYKELRATLQQKCAVQFKDQSNTAVFLCGVKHLGIDEFLRYADGMFAAALFSRKMGVTYLSRDRAGEKSLCCRRTEDGIYFASEPRSPKKALELIPTTYNIAGNQSKIEFEMKYSQNKHFDIH